MCVCVMTSLQTPGMFFTCLTDFFFFEIKKIFESVLLLPLNTPPLKKKKKTVFFTSG